MWIVNNDGISVENVIERYKKTFPQPIQLLTLTEPVQLGAARNRGIAAAHGELIALLDDDDRYRPIHLEQVIKALKQAPQTSLAYDEGLILLEDTASVDDEPHIVATCRFGFPYAELALLETRYDLPHLVPKTFYDVARDFGCEVVPVDGT